MSHTRTLPLLALAVATVGCLGWIQAQPIVPPQLAVTTLTDTQPLALSFVMGNAVDAVEFTLQDGTAAPNGVCYARVPDFGSVRQAVYDAVFWQSLGTNLCATTTATEDILGRLSWDKSHMTITQMDAQTQVIATYEVPLAHGRDMYYYDLYADANHIYLLDNGFFQYNLDEEANRTVYTIDRNSGAVTACAYDYAEVLGIAVPATGSGINSGNVYVYGEVLSLIMCRESKVEERTCYLTTRDLTTGQLLASMPLDIDYQAIGGQYMAHDAQGVHVYLCDIDNTTLTQITYDPTTLTQVQQRTFALPTLAGEGIRYIKLVSQTEEQLCVRLFADDYTSAYFACYDVYTQDLCNLTQVDWADEGWYLAYAYSMT